MRARPFATVRFDRPRFNGHARDAAPAPADAAVDTVRDLAARELTQLANAPVSKRRRRRRSPRPD